MIRDKGQDKSNFTLFDPLFLAKLERLHLVSKRLVRGVQTGKRRSHQLGSSLEFADFRSYYPGDDIRQIDWSAYARLGKWFLKTFLDERETEINLYVDTSLSMGFEPNNKGRMAIQLAAALGYLALHHGDRVRCYSFRNQIEQRLPTQQGRVGVLRLFHFLEQLTFEGEGDLNQAFSTPQAIPRRPGISIILSDGFSYTGYEQGLAYLQGAGQQVNFIHLTSPAEREPELTGDLRLLDCETGHDKQVTISPMILQMYRQTYQQFARNMEEWCFRRSITYVPVSAEESIETVLFNVLQQAGILQSL